MNNRDIYNYMPTTPQEIYDSFNTIVFSQDTRVLHKMLIKNNLYNEIKHLNGDILEFGVFKGASLALWLQLLKLTEPHSLTTVIGFDFFDKEEVLDSFDENSGQRIISGTLEQLLKINFGDPLHSLVIFGSGVHDLEKDMLDFFKAKENEPLYYEPIEKEEDDDDDEDEDE